MKTYERLKYLRESNDLTQKELADALHMDRSVYNKIESGVRPIRDNELIKFADYFKVSIDYLTDRTSDPTPPKKKKILLEIVLFLIFV
ncbi:helix-turn-helix domain-containing protein [Enterococcus hirae]